jgi:hypothetical protein
VVSDMPDAFERRNAGQSAGVADSDDNIIKPMKSAAP